MKIKEKIQSKYFILITLFVLSSFLFGNFVSAGLESAVGSTVGYIIEIFVNLFGQLLMVLIWALIKIAEYNNFITSPAVTTGWVIVRDICNMFFVLILLIISFATILRLENYNVKKLLPKLLLMAVLINFSKTICGILIDISQIVMLTFVNGFKSIGGGSLAELLGVSDYLSLDTTLDKQTDLMKIVGSYILALIYVIISVVVIFIMLSVLILRIVMLWIYIVLSPIAYLTSAFPSGQKYASQWWEEFSKQLIIGPVLAFFIWLSFSIASTPAQSLISTSSESEIISTSNDSNAPSAALTKSGVPENMIKFMIAIAMLMGGLMVAQKAGSIAGDMASGAMSKIKAAGAAPLRKTTDLAKAGAVGAGLTVGRAAVGTAKSFDNLLGKKIIRKEGGLAGNIYGTVRNAPGNIAKNIKQMVAGNSEVNEALHNYYFDEKRDPKKAKLKWNGHQWEKDKNGKFFRRDENGNMVKDANGNVEYAKHDKKELSSWGDFRASTYEGFSSANSGARAAANKAQEEKINEYKKKISDGNLTATQKSQRLSSNTASATEKKALAIDMAERGDFKDYKDVDMARKAIGDNPLLLKKFNEEVDKNQAHLGYDFTTQAGIENFKKRIDSGKVDTTKMDSDAYKDDRIIKALQEYHGKDFGRIMETVYKRGKKYEGSAVEGLISRAKNEQILTEEGDVNPVRKAIAKLTGDIGQAFSGVDVGGGLDSHIGRAMDDLFSTLATKDLAKMKTDNFDANKMKDYFGGDIGKGEDFVRQLKVSVSSQLNDKDLLSIRKSPDVNKKLVSQLEEVINNRRT